MRYIFRKTGKDLKYNIYDSDQKVDIPHLFDPTNLNSLTDSTNHKKQAHVNLPDSFLQDIPLAFICYRLSEGNPLSHTCSFKALPSQSEFLLHIQKNKTYRRWYVSACEIRDLRIIEELYSSLKDEKLTEDLEKKIITQLKAISISQKNKSLEDISEFERDVYLWSGSKAKWIDRVKQED